VGAGSLAIGVPTEGRIVRSGTRWTRPVSDPGAYLGHAIGSDWQLTAADGTRVPPLGGQRARRVVGELGDITAGAGAIQRSLGVIDQAGGERESAHARRLGGDQGLPECPKRVSRRSDIDRANGDAGAVPVRWMLGLGQGGVDLRHEMLATVDRLELMGSDLQRRRAHGINAVGKPAIEVELVH
jgi:hypothetical protein